MKNITYIKFVIAFLSIAVFTSCQDLLDVQDIKTNPNAPADAPIDVLLSGALVGLAESHEDTDVRISYIWGGQLAGLSRQHAGFQIYSVVASTFDNAWINAYIAASQARIIQEKAAVINNKVALGIGQVIEAIQIAKVAALYGDVPYTEAFNPVAFPTPKYDGQVAVYNSLVTLLNTAYTNLNSGLGTVDGSKEFIYGGSPVAWARAAKTLQARLYLHLRDYPNAIASANLGITPGGDALIPHGTSQTIDMNMNFDFFENSRPGDTGFDPPAYLPVFMQSRLDGVPQLPGEAKRNLKTDETALFNHFFQFGVYTAGALDPNTIDGMFTSDGSHPVLTFYENQLIMAEANARLAVPNISNAVAALNTVRAELATGYINGKTIDPAYQALGIQYDPYLAADFLPGGVANPITTGRNQQAGLIYEILSTRFITELAQYEAFNDLRRTAVATPVVKLAIPFAPGKTQFPARFIYTQKEINTNPNTPKTSSGGVADQYQKLPIFQ